MLYGVHKSTDMGCHTLHTPHICRPTVHSHTPVHSHTLVHSHIHKDTDTYPPIPMYIHAQPYIPPMPYTHPYTDTLITHTTSPFIHIPIHSRTPLTPLTEQCHIPTTHTNSLDQVLYTHTSSQYQGPARKTHIIQ